MRSTHFQDEMNQRDVNCHRLPGLNILIDGFKFADSSVSAYFLTHAHADHWAGLDRAQVTCELYMTKTTHELVRHRMTHIDPKLVKYLEVESSLTLDLPEARLKVTPVSANHCLGAVILAFEIWRVPDGATAVDRELLEGKSSPQIFIHTGDMRFSSSVHCESPTLQRLRAKGIDTVWLDTTYTGVPSFPSRESAISQAIQLCKQHQTELQDAVLFVVCTYLIGKEQILLALARELQMKIFLDPRKQALLGAMRLTQDNVDLFTTNPYTTRLHVQRMGWCGDVWPYFQPRFGRMTSHVARFLNSGLGAVSGVGQKAIANASADDDDDGDDAELFLPPAGEGKAAAAQAGPVPATASEHSCTASASCPPPRIQRVVAIVPTGWAIKTKPARRTMSWVGPLAEGETPSAPPSTPPNAPSTRELEHVIHLVPYSEHSCGDELHEFISWLKPAKVEPIVFSDAAHRRRIQHAFRGDISRTAAKAKFIQGLFGAAAATQGQMPPEAPSAQSAASAPSSGSSTLTAAPLGPASGAKGGGEEAPALSEDSSSAIEIEDDDSDVCEVVAPPPFKSGGVKRSRRGQQGGLQQKRSAQPDGKQQRKLTCLFKKT